MHLNALPWVIFTLQNQEFAISSKNVTAISKSLPVTRLPELAEYVPGIFLYRDEVFKLYDLRKLLNLESMNESFLQFSEMMEQRKQDHIKWLKELELSVIEKRPFNLATDPHKCAFGKWYYNYKTDNLLLSRLLSKFENPHSKIHSIAHKVEELKEKEQFDKAKEIILTTNSKELSMMISLFEDVKLAYEQQNSHKIIILKNNDNKCALAVDNVLSVEGTEEIEGTQEYDSLLKSSRVELNLSLAKTNQGNILIRFTDDDFLSDKF